MPTTETIRADFYRELLGFLTRRIRDPELARDLLQEVFIKIHLNPLTGRLLLPGSNRLPKSGALGRALRFFRLHPSLIADYRRTFASSIADYLNRLTQSLRMALHKHDQFTAEDQRVAAIAKALGHPARIAILRLLAARQTCICGDIVQELPLSQSTVSQHLKELKDAGLVRGEIDGPRVCYCLDAAGWDAAHQLLTNLLPVPAPDCAC